MTWFKDYNNYKFPSVNQIETGLITEAMVQIEQAMNAEEKEIYVRAKGEIQKEFHDFDQR